MVKNIDPAWTNPDSTEFKGTKKTRGRKKKELNAERIEELK